MIKKRIKKYKKRKKMKIFLITIILLSFNTTSISAAEDKCVTALEKLKPECNIGKLFGKMKAFSSKNQTINQTLKNQTIFKTPNGKSDDDNKKKFNLKK